MNLPAGMPPLFAAVHPSVKRHLGPEAAGFLSMVFSLSDPDEIRSLLDAAKFREVSLQKDAKALSLPAPADFLWQYLQSTPLAAVVSQASDDARAELEQEVVEKWQEFASGDGMAYQQDVITATALK
jgi:hypothetical protein